MTQETTAGKAEAEDVDQSHADRLRAGVHAWNAWRRRHPEVKADLRRANLRGADLAGTDLAGAHLSGAALRDADLRGTDLAGADLRGAALHGADLRGAALRGADLRGAALRGADLRGAALSEADLRGAHLSKADLRGATLRGADLCGAALRGAILHGADLCQADLCQADLSKAALSGADLSGADLRKAAGLPPAPTVKAIDRHILAAVRADGGAMPMTGWHTCVKQHCRGGWAIALAGEAGRSLEDKLGSCAAGALIYAVSRPDKPVPDFYATDGDALADLERCANEEVTS